MRQNKFLYLWIVQGKYPGVHGWEDLSSEETRKDARARLKEYLENEPEYQHRLIRRRELRNRSIPTLA